MKPAIPDLLDRTLPEHHQVKINQVLARHYDQFSSLEWCQSREAGSSIEVHVGLGVLPDMQFGRVAEITKALADDIERSLPGSKATVTPVLAN